MHMYQLWVRWWPFFWIKSKAQLSMKTTERASGTISLPWAQLLSDLENRKGLRACLEKGKAEEMWKADGAREHPLT